MPKSYVVIAGPTGSGKSALAMALAQAPGFAGEIIGCDSVQIYRGFDIGSAKPSRADRDLVRHHLIDILDWNEDCDAAIYAARARVALDAIRSLGRVPIVVGGTGLYLRALLGRTWHANLPKDESLRAELASVGTAELYAKLQLLDPVRAQVLHPNDRFRVARAVELVTLVGRPLNEIGFSGETTTDDEAFIIKLDPPRADLHAQIERRTGEMLASGLVEEVRGLLEKGIHPTCKVMGSIGYRETVAMLGGTLDADRLGEKIAAATRQYAKRQLTWNRKVSGDLVLESPNLEKAWPPLKAALGR